MSIRTILFALLLYGLLACWFAFLFFLVVSPPLSLLIFLLFILFPFLYFLSSSYSPLRGRSTVRFRLFSL